MCQKITHNLMLLYDLCLSSQHTNSTLGNRGGTQSAETQIGAFVSSIRVYFFKLRSPNFVQRWDLCCGQSVPAAVCLMSLSLPLGPWRHCSCIAAVCLSNLPLSAAGGG